MTTTETVPAIGYSIVSNLDGDRQITAQCFVSEGERDDVVNAKFDRIFRFIDRQKARYELVALRDELSKHRTTLAQLQEDLARADAQHNAAQASLESQMAELKAESNAAAERGYEAHVAAGRRGEYVLSGTAKADVQRLTAAAHEVQRAKDKNTAERDQHRQQIEISIDRFNKAIAEIECKISDREALTE